MNDKELDDLRDKIFKEIARISDYADEYNSTTDNIMDLFQSLLKQAELRGAVEELKNLNNEVTLPPDCPKNCKENHWHHVVVGSIKYRIKELVELESQMEKEG